MGDGEPGADDRYSRTRSNAGSRSAAPTSTNARPRVSPTSASPSIWCSPVTALSGGQAARVGLAALLLSRYDAFLLDEPTNDLDLDGLDRLEEFVQDAAGADRRW
jgi:ATPase subunit of ABC transporter with duplicated ATPase domains